MLQANTELATEPGRLTATATASRGQPVRPELSAAALRHDFSRYATPATPAILRFSTAFRQLKCRQLSE
jgi:hypothetical protein